jgi:hypothetical protein
VQRVLERLRTLGVNSVNEMAGKREAIVFKLPDELTA